METAEALRIIQALADGVDPSTGEVLPETSPYQHPQVIRALHTAIKLLERGDRAERRRSHLPGRAGEPWDEAEEKQLLKGFDSGATIADLARRHERTDGSIRSRLERLGRIQPLPYRRNE
jgi:hypothetical protein